MCGIVGSFQIGALEPISDERIQAALRCIAHRGPDDEGLLRAGRATLGQRRLSIIDTSAAGHQPLIDDGGRYSIIFNGEAFNFQELRATLEAQGHTFHSRTDTEVALRLYTLKGPDFLHDLNGFFALAIHDRGKDELFLARDRFGVKPLWWCETNGYLHFCSELRGLMELGVEREADRHSLLQYLTYHYVPAPHSILKGARKLMPGRSITVNSSGVREDRWYDLVSASHRVKPSADPGKSLFDLLDDAVRIRLIADVPVGTFLSGGVDSSIVSALAARHHKDLHTFSIGYADDPFFDETRYAEEVARHIGSTHTTFKLTREELAANYTRLLDATDEPFADSSALPSFILCERTRKQVTVALSGDGSDEVFGGYQKHQAELRWRSPGAAEHAVTLLAPLWRALPRSRNSALQNRFRQFDRFARLSKADVRDRFLELAAFAERGAPGRLVPDTASSAEIRLRSDAMAQGIHDMNGLNGTLLGDVLTTLPNDMLHKVDLTSMAHSLEVRTPFLDKRVVEFAFSLPAELKFRKGSGKHILRKTFGHLLPANVMTRGKKGFEVPLLELLTGPLTTTVDSLLRRDLAEAAGLDWPEVQRVKRQLGSSDPGTAQATAHALLVYLSWWKKWMA